MTKRIENQALSFYLMDYRKWKELYRQPALQGDASYIKWFLENSKKIDISDNLYKNVILEHPVINTGFTNFIINEPYQIKAGDLRFVYFTFSADAVLRALNYKMYDRFKSEDLETFKRFLQELDEKKYYAIGVYEKEKGWFNYSELASH